MNLLIKISAMILAIVILIVSIFVILSVNEEDKEYLDIEPPKLDVLTEDTSGILGENVTISVKFSDNVNVTQADIFYRPASITIWNTASIFSGIYDINIPEDKLEDWYYYVTVDDAAGNGPVGDPSSDGSVYYTIYVTEKVEKPRKVFIEEGVASWCSNCPEIGQILDEMYDPDNPSFYYVSLIYDKNSKAEARLDNDYNIYGYPTVLFDGGYDVCCLDVTPEEKDVSLFEEKLLKAASRKTTDINLSIDAKWNDSREELESTVFVENKENEEYTGFLKVYITEKTGRWADYNGNSYHYALIDYAINEEITVEANGKETFSEKWLVSSSGFSNIYPENLWIVAVLFNSESTEKYSDPPQNTKPFDAHYVDATDATDVANGTLPPGIGISFPQKWNRYILGIKLGTPLLFDTLVIGKIPIELNVNAPAGVDKVVITIKGLFKEKTVELTEEPYEWIWDTPAFGKYNIIATVYDKEGRPTSHSLEVVAFIL